MVRARLWRVTGIVLFVAMLAAGVPADAYAQGAPDIDALNSQVAQLYGQGKYAEAIAIAEKALTLGERKLGKEHRSTLIAVDNLAALYYAQGRYAEAEPLYKRALAASERVLGQDPDTLISVNNLAEFYRTQGRYAEAEPLFKRALAARERVLGQEHPDTLFSVNNLAALYESQRRYAEAEPLFRRALAGFERVLGKKHPSTLSSVSNLALLYKSQGRYAEAEPLYKRALDASERVLGQEHPSTLISVNNLAALYKSQGRYAEAEPLYKRALDASERVLGQGHPFTLGSVNNLAALYFEQGDFTRATELWRRSTAGIASRTLHGAQGGAVAGKKKTEAEQASWQFWELVKAASWLASEGGAPDAGLAREMFEAAQWAQSSEAAQSLAQMAARGAVGDAALAALVRERQDLVAEWQKRDSLRNAALGQAPDKRNAKAEAGNLARLAAIDARIAEIDEKLKAQFPDYALLTSPAPLAAEEVQALLGADEALVAFLDTPELKPTPEETFIWVVTRTEMRWVRSGLGTAALTREVQALRCGLDANAWTSGPRCKELTGRTYARADEEAGKPLPFDHARAYRLYKALFGQVEDVIRGKQLLLVPSGPLTQLPFQVLVTAPPAKGDDKSAAWLIREHALSVLPAVSSLKALRRVGRPSAAEKPMIGFGNPLLDGPNNGYAQLAQSARSKQSCPGGGEQRPLQVSGLRGGVTQVTMRGGLADVSFISKQAPLPETADELCAVARGLNADLGEIRLGARATERELKRLSVAGELAQYRMVHFATHGALAGQLKGNSEPGLVLTPPGAASEEDDGYLSAPEVAALKLDADWVILSACNTAAGGAQGADALSGLARAFIYAQARALLVSHWAVNSDATVKLVTGAMQRLAEGGTMGRAEAMRRSMLALIDKGGAQDAQPANWAPFIVVGEGAH